MLYMNLSSIALKRLREKASKEQPYSYIPCLDTKKASLPAVSKRHSTNIVSSTTANTVSVQERKVKKTEEATRPPSGTYYLDEIFKTTVNMEMHQKNKPHSSTNHEDLIGVDSIETSNDDDMITHKDHHSGVRKELSNSKAKIPLSFDSTLQKLDHKLKSKREQTRPGSPSVKKQLVSNRTVVSPLSTKSTEPLHDETSKVAKVNTKPASAQLQKLIEKGFAKVKVKSNADQSSRPTNRIPLISNKLSKSSASGSKLPNLAGQQNEQLNRSMGKSVRQISINKSSPLTSPVPQSISNTSTPTTASSTISATKFYSTKNSKSGKIKIHIKSNPSSTPIPTNTEKHSTPSVNYSILKKKEVVLTGTVI